MTFLQVGVENFSIFTSFQRTNNVCESFNSYLKNYEAANINIHNKTNFWKVIGNFAFNSVFYILKSVQTNNYTFRSSI
jgi:hypothetical protein